VVATVDLPGKASSVKRARDHVRGLLVRQGVRDVDDALLLLSEVVTNAIKHTASGRGGWLLVAVADCGGGAVQLEVVDEGSDVSKPGVRDFPEVEGFNGRGLWLVQALALEWGWHEDEAGRTVWFQVAK
jgi:anti-sigma regulatory factor (Ser/Thr protein kinase)